jgi:hypothetical protein
MPVLLVLGAAGDGQRQRALAQLLVEALPDAELVTLDVAHLAGFHRVDLTAPLLARFLEDVSKRS